MISILIQYSEVSSFPITFNTCPTHNQGSQAFHQDRLESLHDVIRPSCSTAFGVAALSVAGQWLNSYSGRNLVTKSCLRSLCVDLCEICIESAVFQPTFPRVPFNVMCEEICMVSTTVWLSSWSTRCEFPFCNLYQHKIDQDLLFKAHRLVAVSKERTRTRN